MGHPLRAREKQIGNNVERERETQTRKVLQFGLSRKIGDADTLRYHTLHLVLRRKNRTRINLGIQLDEIVGFFTLG